MIDFEARQIIEALRSGVSSRTTSQYFSFARPQFIESTKKALQQTIESKASSGMVVSGKYGEGKTHFLNTVFNLAQQNNMVVSHISLSKETPFDKLNLVYQKLASNTYLPGRPQPGFEQEFEGITASSPQTADLLSFAECKLTTSKLYYLLKSYCGTQEDDEKYALLCDIEGDFINNASLKKIYKRVFSKTPASTISFCKTKQCMDYISFLSHFFLSRGYNGWVILFDEAELIGRLGKKARIAAYNNMAQFLFPSDACKNEAVYTIFALAASFGEDVINGKHEFENMEDAAISAPCREEGQRVLERILQTPQLEPLSREEKIAVFEKVIEFHARAYNWTPEVDIEELFEVANKKGHLLRTAIRAAVESLDQLYQYGNTADVLVSDLAGESYNENVPSLDELL